MPPFIDAEIRSLLAKGRAYEEAEARFVKKYLAGGINVVELGGSIGVISSLIRSRIGPEAYHLVVEADPVLAGVCEHNASLSVAPDRCRVFQAAIDYSGASTVTFVSGHNAHTGRLATRGEQGLAVPTISLSEVAAALHQALSR